MVTIYLTPVSKTVNGHMTQAAIFKPAMIFANNLILSPLFSNINFPHFRYSANNFLIYIKL